MVIPPISLPQSRPPPGSRTVLAGLAAWTLLGLLVGGCASKRDHYDVPEVPIPGDFRHSAVATHPERPTAVVLPADVSSRFSGHVVGPAAATDREAAPSAPQLFRIPLDHVLGEWWRLLSNQELDQLVNRVLANNPDIRIATLRVMQSKARAEQANADRYPVITAPVAVAVNSPAGGIGTVKAGQSRSTQHTYQASLRGDWRADLWGERSALYDSADMQVWQATFQADDVRRTVVATTVASYMEYLSLNDRIRVARETETTLTGMLESVAARLESGDATLIDLEQQRSAVSAVRATIPTLEQQRNEVLSALALLAGGLPGSLKLGEGGLSSLAYPGVSPGVPASLLLRRPDVRVVEARLLSSDANIDVARSRLLPPLDLTAQVGYGSLHLSEWGKSHTWMWSAAANLMATIFDKGKRDKEVEFTEAVREELVETYVRVIYNAVREVEDSLAAIRIAGQRVAAQQEASDAARRAYRFSVESYSAGAIDYLTLLDTERTYHRNLDELDKVRMDRYKSLAALFSALGGGIAAGGPLPGEGIRPTLAGSESGYVVSVKPPAELGRALAYRSNVYQGIEIVPDASEDLRGYWLVELAGTYERAHIAPAWIDLRERFPGLMADRSLLPRSRGGYGAQGAERVAWYQLFVAGFEVRNEAETVCAALRQASMRCRTIPAGEVPSYYPVSVVEPVEISALESGIREASDATSAERGTLGQTALLLDPSGQSSVRYGVESVAASGP